MTMIKKLALAASAAALGFAAPAQAAPYTPPSASGDATVRLYTAIDIQNVSDIDFGTIIRGTGASGTVTMPLTGALGCAAAGLFCTGTPSRGHFTIEGYSGSDMSVTMTGATYTPSTNTLQLSNGAQTVDLTLQYDGMTQDLDVALVPQSTFSVTGTGAATDIYLYGSLAVPTAAAAPNGVYTASFLLTADYK